MQDAVSQGGEARADVLAEIDAVLTQGAASAEGQLCVQAVFALVDVLKQWLEQRRSSTASPGSAP